MLGGGKIDAARHDRSAEPPDRGTGKLAAPAVLGYLYRLWNA
jgi:hypothetical protein